MKVIAKVDNRMYLCQIGHTELEKFMNLYYNEMKTLEVGNELDLGKGYDFLRDAQDALKKTEEFITANKEVIEMIVTGISVMSRREETENES